MGIRRVLIITVAVVLGLLLGRISGGGHDSTPAPLLPGSPGPTRLGSGGVGVGYAHTRAGAVAANANYQQAFADAAILRRGELRRRVQAVATPAYAPAMLAANEPGAERLAAGLIGRGLRGGVPTIYLGTPVLYRVLSYSPRRAVIRTWGFTVLGNATLAEPGGYFGTSRTELVWSEDDWKIADTRAAFGPTPRLVTPRQGGEGFDLVDLLKGMRSYAVSP
ncbi:MAG TPA: hypothetical protein VFJ61_06570 [Solirubrobacterales bacterium]|nr:hypothetical protein [Solirubrobacterales bacterium]